MDGAGDGGPDASATAAGTDESDGWGFEAHLRAGIAVYNDGHHHAAHDAWEVEWLDLESDTDDERFLHGLIQFTAAVHHATRLNWAGAVGLAGSAIEYLDPLPATYRGVDVEGVRSSLRTLVTDPERIERGPPPPLASGGRPLALADLGVPAAAVAAVVLGEDLSGYDEAILEDAARYARSSFETAGTSPFLTLLVDFAREPDRRPVVYDRLRAHVERRRAEERDVEGLF